MASVRGDRVKKDGTPYWSVLYREDGKQRSISFEGETGEADAEYVKELMNRVGVARALEILKVERPERASPTLAQYLRRHIDQLTGIEQQTIDKYNGYLKNDIEPLIGSIPLDKLTEADIGEWVRALEKKPGRRGKLAQPKTIANKHGFLSGALNAAVPRLIPANPCVGRTLPRGDGDDHEPVFLTHQEFRRLVESTTPHWRLLMEFLVSSGCRWGEAVALKPSDVDRTKNKIHVRRAWKYSTTNGYELGPPKTKRSRRTIDLDPSLLDRLDYTNEWLFVNRAGGPVRYHGFIQRVWNKAVDRAQLDPRPTPHDLRHTSASWLLNSGVPITTVSRRLGHESIKVTVDVYGHLSDDSGRAAAAVFADVLRETEDD
ncbi:tyrosine-type recombinase/integrase [Mycolicibacterium goodii]|uniref:tyrosine-type recombinase/integrase n=1 Tax=Mycolicibacterium goodii TaxID=134601 RepID=UPI001BDC2310|nr:site-specific integrase [Mycolicibacterium goodii]MBU8834143.1 site-specific integrase [Mycolicibacterium goodii]